MPKGIPRFNQEHWRDNHLLRINNLNRMCEKLIHEGLSMNKYRVGFEINGLYRAIMCIGESEGEALEDFDSWAERFDYPVEVLGIREVEQ